MLFARALSTCSMRSKVDIIVPFRKSWIARGLITDVLVIPREQASNYGGSVTCDKLGLRGGQLLGSTVSNGLGQKNLKQPKKRLILPIRNYCCRIPKKAQAGGDSRKRSLPEGGGAS